jgi:uncharacterized protein (TIRG00374 family)
VKILRLLGIILGLTLLALVLHRVGWIPIRETLTVLRWKYLIALAYPVSWFVLNTMGWRYALHPDAPKVPFLTLVKVRLAGETFNSLLPSSYVGGEPIKAKLLARWIPLRETVSSVLIAKAAQSIGLLLFIGLGLTIGLPPTATAGQRDKAWLAFGCLAIGITIFVWLLGQKSFSRLGHALHRITRWPKLLALEPHLLALDDSLGNFYRSCKSRFLASAGWHGLGWISGMFELVVIFILMGHPISWRAAWFMAALAQLGSVIGLISPGGLGFYEGGHYMAAVLLGLPPTLGLSASLIRRIRELFWDIVGLYYFNRFSKENV